MEKLHLNQEKLELAAAKLRAISHPTRIAILDMLNDKPMSVTEIFNELKMEQASTSHHLNILKSKGVLTSHRQGKRIIYSLKYNTISEIIECINHCHA
ncbi:MAG TPA: metalloregulator ArsR/SmtB family transcription factor [Bacteroidales bacterium]|nr:metalloregulator ArsR/SmtB family transcription factor [Bacteroidales bacterium]HPE57982.1 metalloregulator ArsR/SmtB family transcription factor [Bacteroidales bacterium]HPR57496.1 metalloregulator ArsR/SmtB family transcription factor [Bacteroidales bacterium]HRW97700.1 metalloregulator ArsR/SmtB family transcription factor [Bacteroidales bacterium]